MSAELSAIQCKSCGGTVRLAVGKSVPTCLFCGADAADLVPAAPPEGIEEPVGAVPFAIDEATAQAAFVKFARSSFWYPSDLRSARLELRRLLLPAWAWSGDVETHWTGLVSANTRSGKSPTAGADFVHFEQILVPASRTLRQSELRSLGAYDESTLTPRIDDTSAVELSELTRSAARERAHAEMLARHEATIRSGHGLTEIHGSSLATGLDGKPVLVPVWIGAYRYGRRSFRVLINGQSGRFVGDAPISWWKVVGVTLAVLVIATVLAATCLGGGTLLTALGAAAS